MFNEERVSLIKEVEALKQKRTILDLEKRSKSLEETVDVLRKQRDDLQGEISALGSESEAGEEGQQQQVAPAGQAPQ